MAYSSDIFGAGTAQNFKTGGDGAKSYNWFAKNTANALTMDANTTNAGKATLKVNGVNSYFYGNVATAPVIYQDLGTNDFDVETSMAHDSDQNFEACGIIVAKQANWTHHLKIANMYAVGALTTAKYSNGTIDTDLGSNYSGFQAFIRIRRVGDLFTFYRKANSGDAWIAHASYTWAGFGAAYVGQYAQPLNNNGNLTSQFDYITFNTVTYPPVVYKHQYYSPALEGGTDGEVVSEAGNITMTPVERAASSVSRPLKFSLRYPGTAQDISITPSGTSAALVALAPDDGGKPGTWGAYGDPLTLTSVGATNKCFWIRTKGDAGDAFGADASVTLTIEGATTETTTATVRRKVVPSVGLLGSASNYFLGIDWGSSVYWKHNAAGNGECDVIDTGGTRYSNIVFPNYSVNGDDTDFTAATVKTGLTVTAKLTKMGEGIYKITYTFTSTTKQFIMVERYLKGAGVSSGASFINDYNQADTQYTDDLSFQAAGLHHSSNGCMAAIEAGCGYDNDYTIFTSDYLANTSWYNTQVITRVGDMGDHHLRLLYGYAKSTAPADSTVELLANVPRTLTYVINTDVVTSQAEVNESMHSAYHDAFSTFGAASRSGAEKMLWSTAHQLQWVKRNPQVEGSRVHWIVPCSWYSPFCSLGDIINITLGLGDPEIMLKALDVLHRLGPVDGNAPAATLLGSAGNTLDGTNALYLPMLELYAKKFLGYAPDTAAEADYITAAEHYADAINTTKLLSDAGNQKAHFYSDPYAGGEPWGFGDFEQPLSFAQATETRYRWAITNSGTGATTRVGMDGGNAPHGGSYQLKQFSNGVGHYTYADLMKIAVPASKEITPKVYINIPAPFTSGGMKIQAIEYNASMVQQAITETPQFSTTSGQELKTLTLTLNANTVYLVIRLRVDGQGTAYSDDVQCTINNPAYRALWSLTIMPPQVKGNSISPNIFCNVWAQLNLKSLKALIPGGSWTQAMQDALDNINAAYPAAYWTDANHIKIKADLYHHRWSTWLHSYATWGHFMWYVLSGGEKIFSDQEMSDIYANWPSSAVGYTYGAVAKKGWIMHIDGTGITGAERTEMFLDGYDYVDGYYINAAGWLWAADAFLDVPAHWAGVASAALDLQKRIKIEVSKDFNSHEALTFNTGHSAYQSCDQFSWGYGSNVLVLMSALILTASNITADGADLDWTAYTSADFTNYKICRSADSPVLVTDDITTITNQATLTFTDDTAAANTPYFYAVFVTKNDDSTVKSNEVFLTTLEAVGGGKGFPMLRRMLRIRRAA